MPPTKHAVFATPAAVAARSWGNISTIATNGRIIPPIRSPEASANAAAPPAPSDGTTSANATQTSALVAWLTR